MGYNYSYNEFNKETMARASASNAPISLKKSVEVASLIRGKKLSYAISILEKVTEKRAVVPYRRYKAEMAHKKGAGIDTGGYPVHVAKAFLVLLKSAQKNASEQEIGEKLYVLSVSARKGSARYHYGRNAGRKMKSTNVEVVVGLKESAKEEKKE